MTPSERLAAMNLTLPPVAHPVGAYVPALRAGAMIYTSGQLPTEDGSLVARGKVPDDVPLLDAQASARLACLNALAAAADAAGGVDRIARIVRVNVFVNSAPGFHEQAKVANGASEFLQEVFGEAGRHTRSAIGAAELPLNAPVELDLIAMVQPEA